MILEELQRNMSVALKEGNKERLSVLRLLVAEIKNEAFKEAKKRSEDEIVLAYHKKLISSREDFGSKSKEFLDKITFEISVVEEFLPKQMSEDEVRAEIKSIEATGVKIELKTVMPIFKGRADSKMVQGIVQNWNS